MIPFFALTGLLNFLAAIGLVLYTTVKSRKNAIYWVFVCLNVALGVWSFGYWRWLSSTNAETALFWARILSIGSTLIPVFFLHWVALFLKIARRRAIVLVFAYLLTGGLLYFSFSDLFVATIRQVGTFPYWPEPGILYHGYIIGAYIGFIGYALWLLWKQYRSSKGQMRLRIRYIFLGLLIGVVGGFTNFPAWYGVPIPPYGNAVTMFFFFSCAYAMVQYRLRDIRHVIASGFVYLTTFMITIFVAIGLWRENLFDLTGAYHVGIITLFAVILYQVLREILQRGSGEVFFSGIVRKEETLLKVANQLPHMIEYQKVIDLIIDTIKDAFQLERIGVILRDKEKKEVPYQIARIVGFDKNTGISLVKDSFFTKHMARTKKPLVKEELYILQEQSTNLKDKEGYARLLENLTKIEVDLSLPLMGQEGLFGIIVLGPKLSGETFTKEELDILSSLINQAAIAIENAQLYQEVQDFNKNLKKKVAEQTNDIVAKAERLEKLAKMRSEFLDIASHQLRTPVSVINGTLSMMMEGDLDKMPKKEKRQFISNMYHKGLKLEAIIEDILSASEMDTDTFSLTNTQEVNIGDIAESVVKEREDEAKRKGLRLLYQKPEESVPNMQLNAQYIKQAITNLVDNAIKYSGIGTIKVVITVEERDVLLTVNDQGIGIPKEDLPKLFGKFMRAKNATEMYTDGSGLGLFIVKQVVEAHGGRVWVESLEDEGSTFYVKLPVQFQRASIK